MLQKLRLRAVCGSLHRVVRPHRAELAVVKVINERLVKSGLPCVKASMKETR
jgi:hypothetical protein